MAALVDASLRESELLALRLQEQELQEQQDALLAQRLALAWVHAPDDEVEIVKEVTAVDEGGMPSFPCPPRCGAQLLSKRLPRVPAQPATWRAGPSRAMRLHPHLLLVPDVSPFPTQTLTSASCRNS